MKKFALLALAMLLLVPNLVNAQCTVNGTYLVWYGAPYELPAGNIPIFAGQTLSWNTYVSGEEGCLVLCVDAAENCGYLVVDTETGWLYNEDAGICAALPSDGCWIFYFDVTAPVEAVIGTVNEALLITCYCNDVSGDLDLACATDTMFAYFEVVKPPVEIEIFQDTLTEVDQGVTAAYIPFQICNGDPAADPRNYTFNITSQGTVGPALDQDGTLTGVPGGDCDWVYGIVDASAALIGDVDTLTIIGRYKAGPVDVRDTCVQAILIVEPVPVPLFTRPVVTIMVLAMILAAAVVMKRRAKSVA